MENSVESITLPLFNQVYEVLHAAYNSGTTPTKENKKKAAAEVTKLIIDSRRIRGNPYGKFFELGSQTLFESAETLRRQAYGGWKKWVPRLPDDFHNAAVGHLGEMVPNVDHYMLSKLGLLRPDNPIVGVGYGTGLGTILTATASESFPLALPVMGGIAGFGAMMALRNRDFVFSDKKDYANARVWDTTQFLDAIGIMICYANKPLEDLTGQPYIAPLYPALDKKRRHLAYDNLETNPFLGKFNINITF